MKCRDLEELLSAYVDGELSRTQREFVEEHLSSCSNCRATLECYRAINQKLTSLKETPALSNIKGATMSKIKGEHISKPSHKWLSPALATTTIVAFVTVLLTGVLEMSGTTGGVMSPPPLTWEKLNLILNLYYLLAFLIMQGRILVNNMYTRFLVGIGSILFGVIGIGVGLHEFQIGHTESLLIMGTISAFGIIMGLIYIIKRNVNRWAAVIGILLCIFTLVLEAIIFIVYPIPQLWLTIVTVVISIGIIIYAFQRELKQPPRIWLRPALVISVIMATVAVLLATQLRSREIPGTTGSVMSPPPFSYIILSDIGWIALLMGALMMLGLALRNRFARAVADIGSILFGIIGWYIGLYALTMLKSDLFLAMGIIPIFGLIMGIVAIRKSADRRWLALLGVVLCISALVLDTIFLITYPVIHVWVIIATVLIPVSVIIYTVIKK